jgi:hypothetical protein
MISLIYGGIYSLGDTQSSIQDRFGLLSLVAIGAGNLAIASTIRTFPKEKTIVQADRAKQLYGVGPYFLSKVVAEAPLSALLSAMGGVLLYPLVGLQWVAAARTADCRHARTAGHCRDLQDTAGHCRPPSTEASRGPPAVAGASPTSSSTSCSRSCSRASPREASASSWARSRHRRTQRSQCSRPCWS